MTSLGDALRSERIRRGLEIQQIAAETKIGAQILKALEEERFDQLPAGAYRRNFIRQYAHTLGLDEDEAIASFKQRFIEPELPLPAPPVERRSTHLGLVWAVLMLMTCATIYILRQNEWLTSPPSIVRGVSALMMPSAGKAASNAGEAASKKTARLSTMAPDNTPKDPIPGVGQVADAEPASLQDAEPASLQDESQKVHVEFATTEPVWISVMCDGVQVYTGTLEEGQSKEFSASTKLTVLVGNAGGVRISLNGKPLGPLGGQGETRWLELSSAGARIVRHRTATP
jgi:cytoskeleton protein RodZ